MRIICLIFLSNTTFIATKCWKEMLPLVCPNVTERFASCILCVKNFVLIRKVCSRKHFIFTSAIKPLQSNISIFILHTVHQYISFGTDKENLLNDQSFLSCWSFPLFTWTWWLIQQCYSKEELDPGHCWGLKG